MLTLNLITQHPNQKLPLQKLRRQAKQLSTILNFRELKINFLFTTSKAIRKIHQRFFQKNSATDVITFADAQGVDIVISLDQAWAQAKPRGLKPIDEVLLLMCHGLLHAKGFDDLNEKNWLEMRRQEFESLAKVL